ncbi:hypothetical protein BDW72DRAFT_164423 [Aspergillus terricola var. indicus]
MPRTGLVFLSVCLGIAALELTLRMRNTRRGAEGSPVADTGRQPPLLREARQHNGGTGTVSRLTIGSFA